MLWNFALIPMTRSTNSLCAVPHNYNKSSLKSSKVRYSINCHNLSLLWQNILLMAIAASVITNKDEFLVFVPSNCENILDLLRTKQYPDLIFGSERASLRIFNVIKVQNNCSPDIARNCNILPWVIFLFFSLPPQKNGSVVYSLILMTLIICNYKYRKNFSLL